MTGHTMSGSAMEMTARRSSSTHLLFLSRHLPEEKWVRVAVGVPADGRIVVPICVLRLAPRSGRVAVHKSTRMKPRHQKLGEVGPMRRSKIGTDLQQLFSRILARVRDRVVVWEE